MSSYSLPLFNVGEVNAKVDVQLDTQTLFKLYLLALAIIITAWASTKL